MLLFSFINTMSRSEIHTDSQTCLTCKLWTHGNITDYIICGNMNNTIKKNSPVDSCNLL